MSTHVILHYVMYNYKLAQQLLFLLFNDASRLIKKILVSTKSIYWTLWFQRQQDYEESEASYSYEGLNYSNLQRK